jgi:D-alanyl-D-alanine carboxypeptidase/D-alanyl-D-alanine-endopeptidase (penicillin-binding protein 4)
MRRGKQMRVAFASLLVLWASAPLAAEGPWAGITATILQNERLPSATYGIEVRDLESGALLFSDGGENLLNPASSIKVLTSAAVLSKLGPNHRFTTVLKRSGDDLCLIGGGDPSLVNETMWLLAEEARRKGVARIAGQLIADDSLFPATRDHLEEFEGDGARAFTAPIGALSVNFNSLTIHAEPTGIGTPPRLFLDPDLPIFRLKNRARTVRKAARGDLSASIEPEGGFFSITVGGNVSAATERTTIYRAIPDPALYAAAVFARHLGIDAGKIRKGKCPPDGSPLLEFPSKPLSQVVFDLNKFSNNFIAEMLLRSTGGEPRGESGREEMRSWLVRRGIPAAGTVLDNASGLSRKTRVSPRTLVAVVRAAANDLAIGPEFLASFGIAATDGTLHRRFRDLPPGAVLRAKSGSLSGVVSLTGVLQRPDGTRAAFCTIFNTPSKPNGAMQRLEERLIGAWIDAKSR